MAFFIDAQGHKQELEIPLTVYQAARDDGKTVAHYINTMHIDANPNLALGTVFDQVCASTGLALAGPNPFGLKSPVLADIFDGKSSFSAGNTQQRSSPFGTESRTLFPAAVIQMIEDSIQPDRVTDDRLFRNMVALNMSIGTDTFEQPVLSYGNAGGANSGVNGARAGRISQLGGTPMMLQLTTSDRYRKLPTYGIGIEMSDQAMKGTSLDMLVMTTNRYIQIEKDARVYGYLSNAFAGDADHNTGAVGSVTSSTLNGAATNGVLTHKAYVKFLARKRRQRRLTTLIMDLDTYLKVEGRTGRPGSNNYDPTLERIDPQAKMMNDTFGGDVSIMLVDSAAEGGPVPANTIWAMDKLQALMMVNNTSADFKATEDFVLRRSKVMVWHWGEECFRMYGDEDLTPFDVLVID